MAGRRLRLNSELGARARAKLPAPRTSNAPPKPGEYSADDYAARGWASSHQHQPGSNQLSLDLGPNHPPMQRALAFDDLPQEHQDQIKKHVQEKYGLAYEDLVHNTGRSIDHAFIRADQAKRDNAFTAGQPTKAAGQTWYAGGPGTAQQEVQDTARTLDLPPHVVGGMRAAVSPNMPADKETNRVLAIGQAMQKNPDPAQFKSGGEPSGGMHWSARNAARVMQEHLDSGTKPTDVVGEDNRGKSVPAIGAGDGPKPPSYYQAYSHPFQGDGRPPVDRWAYRGAFATDDETAKKIQEHGLVDSRVPDPTRPGHMTHGVNLYTAKAIAEASQARGLAPHEGQAVQWNEDKDEAEGRHSAGPPGPLSPHQFPGQGSLF